MADSVFYMVNLCVHSWCWNHFAGQREHTRDVASFLKELAIAREYFASKLCFWKCLRNSNDVMAIIMILFVLYIDSRQTNPTMYHYIPVASLCILNKEYQNIYIDLLKKIKKKKGRRERLLLLRIFMPRDILHIQFYFFLIFISD